MKKTVIAIVSMLMLSGACWSDDTETNINEAKYYDNAKVIRVKNVEGEGFVQRSYEEGNEEATPNLPLFEKDTVGTTEGRLDIYLGRLNYLRLDADSVIVLEKIPQLRKTDLNVRVERGSIYLDIESLDSEKGIEIQTPDCGIFILDKGLYRVNVSEDSQTEVLVLEGIAEVAGRESSRNVRENQKIVMSAGEIEERPYYFASDKDDFDRWSETQNRELSYARYSTSRYLQNGYEDSEYEMSRSGRWSYMPEFRSYAWIPYHTNADWMPYSNGRWVWNPYYGYIWVSYDTCGWYTHHYGRWHWSYSFGWHWIPGYHWSPAWVSWFGNDQYYGWCPLSWWNRPVIIVNNYWDRHYDYRRGIPHHSRSSIIIRKNELSAPHAQRVALSKGTLGQNNVTTLAYRGLAPVDRPALAKVTVINAKGKAVTYKQSGIVSISKYHVASPDSGSGKAAVYKYIPDAGKDYGSAYKKKSGDDTAPASGSAYKSKSSGLSSGTRARHSSSEATAGKSSEKAVYRSKSGSSGKSSSSSSSSSSNSSGTVKKKKGEPQYFTRSGYGDANADQTATAANARYQSKYAASPNGEANRFSYRTYESRFKTAGGSAAAATGTASYRSRSTLSNQAASPFTGSYFSSRKAAGGSTGYSAPSASATYRAPASSPSRGYSSSRSTSSYSSSSRSLSSGSSSDYRSNSRSSSASRSTASSSQSSSGTAKKKN